MAKKPQTQEIATTSIFLCLTNLLCKFLCLLTHWNQFRKDATLPIRWDINKHYSAGLRYKFL